MAGTAVVAPIIKHRSRGVVRISVAMTCDASGVISETVIGEAYGRLVGVFYDGGLDASAVITLRTAASEPNSTVGATLLAYKYLQSAAQSGVISGNSYVVVITDGEQSDRCSETTFCKNASCSAQGARIGSTSASCSR